MAETRPRPPFGDELDLDLEDLDTPFGTVDLDIASEREPAPESQVRRPTPPGHPGRATPPAMNAVIPKAAKRTSREPEPEVGDSTRIVPTDAMASLRRGSISPSLDDGAPPSSRSKSAQSESGIAHRDDRVAAMRELYARGDADAALALAETITTGDGAPPAEAGADDGLIPIYEGTMMVTAGLEAGVEAACRGMLSLTERHSIPRIVKPPAEIAKLPIDPRGGFLLAQVDGMQTLEEILDVCAMPAAEALDLIEQLKELGVILFE